ncbi:hypothetical protein HYC85_029710 [Camellia sinensis]|uniref:Uncharacterized protein n=1 Tax=Camellia sinensis TaxID=4442 RepID=A0A7J7FYV4_CAMSI|nr:hypothetical protein HYC85_029710 [Camellia sinensis]
MKVHILCNGRASNMHSGASDLPFGGLGNTLSSKGDTLFILARDNICCCFNCHSDLKQAYTWGRDTLILQRNGESGTYIASDRSSFYYSHSSGVDPARIIISPRSDDCNRTLGYREGKDYQNHYMNMIEFEVFYGWTSE